MRIRYQGLMLVMDSGLGGLSVVRALRTARPGVALTYVADTACFPYGGRAAGELLARATTLIEALQKISDKNSAPTRSVVLACNTLSTLCLADLRARFALPFVGTVPAVKVAARFSKTKRFTLLATPNTAESAYSKALIEEFAAGCVVDCYGAPNLARMAEALLLGEVVSEDTLVAEIAPIFHDDARGKTDAVVLGCTHYPLIGERLLAAAPWNVAWIDSGEAIARRALSVVDAEAVREGESVAYVTRAEDVTRYRDLFLREGFADVRALIS